MFFSIFELPTEVSLSFFFFSYQLKSTTNRAQIHIYSPNSKFIVGKGEKKKKRDLLFNATELVLKLFPLVE